MFFGKNLKYLRVKKGLKQDEMQSGTGISRATWSDYERNNTQPDFSVLIKISEYFGVGVDDLLKVDLENKPEIVHLTENKGDENKGANVHLNVHPNVHLKGINKQNQPVFNINILAEEQAGLGGKTTVIPITDISVAAGGGLFNNDHIENVESLRLPVQFLKRNATYLCVKVKGISMAPTLQDGGYVIIRLLDRSEWATMPDECLFVVSDTDGKSYLKRVKNRFKKGFIVLRSDSPDRAVFPSFNLTPDEINTIWYVEWNLTAKMPNIHDQYYQRLQQLEDRVDELSQSKGKTNR